MGYDKYIQSLERAQIKTKIEKNSKIILSIIFISFYLLINALYKGRYFFFKSISSNKQTKPIVKFILA
jgi:uncharacterized membrane protein